MEQQVSFNNYLGEKLSGTLHLPDDATESGIVLGHCFTCSRNTAILRHLCEQLVQENFMALRFDFSGNGRSEGQFADSTYSKQISEMQTAVAFILKKGVSWVGLVGHSMGAVIAVLTAARMSTVKSACVLAGRMSGLNATHFFSPSQLRELRNTGSVSFTSRGRSLKISNSFFADTEQYNLPEIVANLRTPLLVVHGDQDEIIPVQEAYQAHRLNPEGITLSVVTDADHMFSNVEHRNIVIQQVVAWFKEQRGTMHGYP